LESDSFIDQDLQALYSDLLYQVETRTGQPSYIYLLLEHKSSPDPLTPFQLLRYLVRIWERTLRWKVKQFPPVVPLVVYHGRSRWHVATDFGELFNGPEPLRLYWPAFHYEIQDLGTYSDEELRGAIYTKVVSLILRDIRSPRLKERLLHIFRLLWELANKETALEYLETILRYVSAAAESVTQEALMEVLETALSGQEGDIMPTIAERWIEQGLQKGLQKGFEEGLLQGQQALRESILDLLHLRFDVSSSSVVEQLGAVRDIASLRALLRHAATATTLAEFEQFLASLSPP